MKRVLLAGLAGALLGRPVQAQVQASLGAGVSTVRSPVGNTSSPSLSPAIQWSRPQLYGGLSGAVASLGQGVWSGQGRASLWLATPPVAGGLRLAADGTAGGTTRTGGPWTAATSALGEVMLGRPRWGFGLGAGASSGWIQDQPSVTAFHGRARGWLQTGSLSWLASAEPTRLLGAWYTDATAGVTVDRGRVVASVWGLARFSRVYGSRAVASAFVQLFVAPNLSLELGGGGYLPDPYQGLPRGRYLSAGIRLHATRRTPRLPMLQAQPLVPEWRGDSVIVRFRFPSAASVSLAGDWDDWQAHPLQAAGGGAWEGRLALAPGLYHFILQVDGREWVVPAGVANIPDGMGGLTALLLVEPPS